MWDMLKQYLFVLMCKAYLFLLVTSLCGQVVSWCHCLWCTCSMRYPVLVGLVCKYRVSTTRRRFFGINRLQEILCLLWEIVVDSGLLWGIMAVRLWIGLGYKCVILKHYHALLKKSVGWGLFSVREFVEGCFGDIMRWILLRFMAYISSCRIKFVSRD